MPNQTSAPLKLSARVRLLVAALARQRSAAYRQVQRAELLLAMADGVGHNAVARTQAADRAVVRKWRTRWGELARKLAHAETTEATDAQLSELSSPVCKTCPAAVPPRRLRQNKSSRCSRSRVKTRRRAGCRSRIGHRRNSLPKSSNATSRNAFPQLLSGVF